MQAIYLDVCCLNRPFDDQTQERIKLESEAIILILKHIENKDWLWVSSEIVDFEIDKIPNLERKQRIRSMKIFPQQYIAVDEARLARGAFLQAKGFDMYDAIHVACAEYGNANIMLTTDDKLKRLANRYAAIINIRIENPLLWLQEQLYDSTKHDL